MSGNIDPITALDYAVGDYFMSLIETGLSSTEAGQRVGSLLIQTGINVFREHTQVSDASMQHGVGRMLAQPRKSPEETAREAQEIIKRRSPQ
jgi:hypothetical protein